MMNKLLHRRDKIDRLCVMNKSKRSVANIEDCVEVAIQDFDEYIKNKGLITAANKSNVNWRTNNRVTKSRKPKWKVNYTSKETLDSLYKR